MREVITIRYHFGDDREDAVSDSGLHRAIEDLEGMLSVAEHAAEGPERRACVAMTQGFTMEQMWAYIGVLRRACEAARERIEALPEPLRAAKLADLAGVKSLAERTVTDLVQLVRDAERWKETGMRKNSADRKREAAACL